MPLALQQVQKLSQRLVMTPQMQLSVKLLQMNTLELEEIVQQEILENPFLDLEDDSFEPDLPAGGGDGEEQSAVIKTAEDSDEFDPAPDDGYSTSPEKPGNEENRERGVEDSNIAADVESSALEDQPEQFDEVDTDWVQLFEDSDTPTPRSSGTPNDEDEYNYEETIAGQVSLYDVLERQLTLSALDGQDLEIGRYLIGCIDEKGYLTASLEQCAAEIGVSPDAVEAVLRIMQEFDPTGVFARDLTECLALQLEAKGHLTPLARAVLSEHWPEMLRKRFREIARDLKVGETEISSLFDQIGQLDPSPGLRYSREQPQYISPDVYVKLIDGEYICYLNEGQVAHLRLSRTYRDILLRGDDPNQDPKEREYALEKYRAAVMFIKNVEKRRSTILRVTEAIMDYQSEFLKKGVQALRPLALSEIAAVVEMHESTISRVTSGKYVDTPQGLFELKFFFSSAIESSSGEAASSRAIKQQILEIIAEENPKHPLSDDKITRILKTRGFTIARRTVAKYREQLKILPTNLRKQAAS